ncbi:uncharacterized protein isoform X2 [Choristoneura fumiferana]|uniref:uncharacterized protein isoform X2 n=1 Tax=Choristoneura fumiferana TaxID=7141 RepID=UPI003D15A0E0
MEHERRRYEYERRHSPSHHRESRSYSRSHDPREERYRRSPSRRSCRSPSRDSHRHSHVRDMSPRSRQGSATRKPLTDREKILEEYRKNYCQTSEDFIEKMEKWSKEHNHEEEEAPKMWYRSSPAELYYKPAENGVGVQQTQKLERICDTFFKKVIERGRKARPEVDELPPLKPPKAKMCKHRWRWRCLLGARQLLCEPETAPGECWAHGPSRSRARRCRRATPRPQPPPAPPPPPPTLCSAQGRTVTDSYAI